MLSSSKSEVLLQPMGSDGALMLEEFRPITRFVINQSNTSGRLLPVGSVHLRMVNPGVLREQIHCQVRQHLSSYHQIVILRFPYPRLRLPLLHESHRKIRPVVSRNQIRRGFFSFQTDAATLQWYIRNYIATPPRRSSLPSAMPPVSSAAAGFKSGVRSLFSNMTGGGGASAAHRSASQTSLQGTPESSRPASPRPGEETI